MQKLILLTMLVTAALFGQTAHAKRFSLYKFRLTPSSVSQAQATTYALFVNWAPKYMLSRYTRVGVSLGGTFLQNARQERFLVTEYQATFGYFVSRLVELEPAVGLQSWGGGGGTALLAGANASYLFPQHPFTGLERIVFGYQRYFGKEGRAASQIRLGVGLSF